MSGTSVRFSRAPEFRPLDDSMRRPGRGDSRAVTSPQVAGPARNGALRAVSEFRPLDESARRNKAQTAQTRAARGEGTPKGPLSSEMKRFSGPRHSGVGKSPALTALMTIAAISARLISRPGAAPCHRRHRTSPRGCPPARPRTRQAPPTRLPRPRWRSRRARSPRRG